MGGTGQARAIWILAILLAATFCAVLALAIPATRPLIGRDDPLLERTMALAADELRIDRSAIRRDTFPIAFTTSSLSCVELRAKRADQWGYQACYDRRTGAVVEQISRGVPLGPRKFWPPLTPFL